MSGNEYQVPEKADSSNHTIQQNKSEIEMSKVQNENKKDVFAVCAQSFDKIHGNLEKTTPQYLQAFTNLQQEYRAAFSNYVHSVISIQQYYANKIGVNTSTPAAAINVANNVTDEIVKAFDVQNKIVQTAIDATKANIKTISENASSFTELNKNIINSCVTAWNK